MRTNFDGELENWDACARWQFADADARLSADIADASSLVGEYALQLDDGTCWRLRTVAPATWARLVKPYLFR